MLVMLQTKTTFTVNIIVFKLKCLANIVSITNQLTII